MKSTMLLVGTQCCHRLWREWGKISENRDNQGRRHEVVRVYSVSHSNCRLSTCRPQKPCILVSERECGLPAESTIVSVFGAQCCRGAVGCAKPRAEHAEVELASRWPRLSAVVPETNCISRVKLTLAKPNAILGSLSRRGESARPVVM